MPEPMSSQDASAFFLLAKEVSKKQKVVLSGQGADELFGGYPWYMLMSNENYKSDIQIARLAKMKPIKKILAKIKVPDNNSAFSPMGRHIAKINFEFLNTLKKMVTKVLAWVRSCTVQKIMILFHGLCRL